MKIKIKNDRAAQEEKPVRFFTRHFQEFFEPDLYPYFPLLCFNYQKVVFFAGTYNTIFCLFLTPMWSIWTVQRTDRSQKMHCPGLTCFGMRMRLHRLTVFQCRLYCGRTCTPCGWEYAGGQDPPVCKWCGLWEWSSYAVYPWVTKKADACTLKPEQMKCSGSPRGLSKRNLQRNCGR